MSDSTARPTVGFIGLGIMGRPMVRNLAAAGFELVVHNRSRGPVDELAGELNSVSAGSSPADVTSRTDIVITMLPDTPDVEKVIAGEQGVLSAVKPGQLVIDMSTISPDVTIALGEKLREAGASLLDAPVSGGEKGAIDAVLSIMAGGSEEDFARAQPLFAAMGKTIVHVGGPGAGQTVKMCNQIAVAINIAGVSEALMLGARAGVDPSKVAQVLAGGLAGSRVMDLKSQAMIDHQFAPGFRVELHRKDLRIARGAAAQRSLSLPVASLVTELFESLAANGGDTLDHSALVSVYERLAGFQLGDDVP
jgi:2-hydroxy-3-oxopropionate reductase